MFVILIGYWLVVLATGIYPHLYGTPPENQYFSAITKLKWAVTIFFISLCIFTKLSATAPETLSPKKKHNKLFISTNM